MAPGIKCGSRLRFGKFGGALLAVTGFLAGCDDSTTGGSGDGGADAGTGFVSADPRGDGGGGIDTQDLSVGIDTSESPDNLSVDLDSLGDASVTSAATSESGTSAPETSVPHSSEATSAAPTSGEVPTSAPDVSSGPAPTTSVDTSVPGVDTSAAPVDTSLPVLETSAPPGDTSVAAETSVPPLDTSVPPDTSAPPVTSIPTETSLPPVDTSVPVIDTSVPPIDTSVAPDTSMPPVATSAPIDTTSIGETSVPPQDWELSLNATATWVDLPATFSVTNLPDVNLTFTWSVDAVPAGSEITSASLSNANGSQATFVPDVGGNYTLSVLVASGNSSSMVAGTVEVSNVDVGYLDLSSAIDGGYVYEPKMIPSDQTSEPFVVGCPFDTWDWAQRDYTYWRDALLGEARTIGFRYPNDPREETLFAYHYRFENGREWEEATHVASAKSDCRENRPTDLQVGYYPDFSTPGKDLARIGLGDGSYLLSSPIDVNQVVYLTASSPNSSDWWDETTIAWSGMIYNGNFSGPGVSVSSIGREGSATILNCSFSDSRFESIDRVAVVAGGLMVLSDYSLWYVPVRNDENGNPYAPCDYLYDGNIQIAGSVADFEVAPDRKTLALITWHYPEDSQEPRVVLGVGPMDTPFEVDGPAWRAYEIGSPFSYYTGLHWIADSQQLVWTEVQYTESDGYTFIDDSIINKINADGSYRRTLVYNSQDVYPENVVTTGVVELPYYDRGNF